MSFTNLTNDITFEAQFNPVELDEEIQANWEEIAISGLPHLPHQYKNTTNHKFSFKLEFAAIESRGSKPQNKAEFIHAARNYIISLMYPDGGSETVTGGAPPRFLFVWPAFLSLTCVMHSAKFRHFHFARTGFPMNFTADIMIKEIRDSRLLSDDALFNGTIRSGDSNQGED